MNVKLRLILLNFLQFAAWGAYLTSMGKYLGAIGLGDKIPIFYAMQGIVSIFMPAILGIIADRWIPAQRLLGFAHLIAGVAIAGTGYVGMVNGSAAEFSVLFGLYSLSVMFYMPTIALSNSVAYTILKNNNMDIIKAFPPIRTLGTVGFICAMLFVNFAGINEGNLGFNFNNQSNFESFQNTYAQFFVSAILSFALFLFSFALPNCPTSPASEKQSFSEAFGLKAFALFKDKRMAIFFIFSMLLGVSLQITNAYANPFISSFGDIEEYSSAWGVNNANALISLSQVSETLCILLIPYCLKKFGIKKVMLMAMFSWFLRFGLFAIGDPGSGVWMFILSMIVYGVAFDFFNVSGSLFVDQETDVSIRSSAQGVFMMMTNGFGATIGVLVAGAVVNHFNVFTDATDAITRMKGWESAWSIFALYALIVALVFMVIFKYKHEPEKLENVKH